MTKIPRHMYTFSPSGKGTYIVQRKDNGTLRAKDEKYWKSWGATMRSNLIYIDPWLLWNQQVLDNNSSFCPEEVAIVRKLRAEKLAQAEQKGILAMLSPEQLESVRAFWENVDGSAFRDESDPGTGKTAWAISVALVESVCVPILVVTFKSCSNQWSRELEKFGYKGNIEVVQKRDQFVGFKPSTAVVTHYEALPYLSEEGKDQAPLENFLTKLPRGPFFLIIDECQKVKNSKAGITKRVNKLCRAVQKQGGYVLGLSATPYDRDEKAVWSLIRTLGFEKKAFGCYDHFLSLMGGQLVNRFRQTFVEFDPFRRQADEIQRRFSRCRVKRHKRHRERLMYFVDVELPKTTVKALDGLLDEYETVLYDDHQLNMVMELENLSQIKASLAKAKVKACHGLLDDLEQKYSQVLVFGCGVEAIRDIGSRKGYAHIDGSTSQKARDKIVQEFQEGVWKGLAFTADCAGVGLNLPSAQCMVGLDLHYNEGQNVQVMGRNDRHTTTHERLDYYILRADHPFEKLLYDVRARKAGLDADLSGVL